MNDKLILVKAFLLIYRESLVPANKDDVSGSIIRKSLELIKKAEVTISLSRELDIITNLKNEVLEMLGNSKNHVYVKEDLINRIKLLTGSDEVLYETLYDGITTELDEFKLKQAIINDRRSLAAFNKQEELAKVVSLSYSEYFHNKDKITDFGKWVEELQAKLEPFKTKLDQEDPAISDEVDFNDEQSVSDLAKTMSEEINGDLGFMFGLQDINAMFNGKLRRGETFVVNALQHNYKTGFTLSMFVHAAVFNTPTLLDKTKKPLLVRISFEDSTSLNLQFIYKYLYENETGKVIDEEDVAVIDPAIIAAYCREKLTATGFSVKILKVDPLLWTLNDLFNKIIEYESQGYEVQLCMVDYLHKLPTTGCVGNNGSEEYRNMLERTRQFFLKRKCLFVTPWQISTDAKTLIREGANDFVKLLPGRGYNAGSKQIDQVLDAEIFIHKEISKGVSYLTVQAGKLRRIVKPTDDKTYRVYSFVPKGCIPWDIGKPNSARLKIGGETIGAITGEGDNWDHFGDL